MNKGQFTKEQMTGKKNPRWKGDDVGYSGLHAWVLRILGKPIRCENCPSKKNLQWANISKKYKRDINDWKQLCVVCHRRFDGITKLSKEDARQIRLEYKKKVWQHVLAKKFNVSQMTISRLLRHIQKYYE